MAEISRDEFARLPLRVHALLAGVPLHDVWAVNLPHPRSGITLAEFIRRNDGLLRDSSLSVRALLAIRYCVGGWFGWDSPAPDFESFAERLTATDRARSLVPAGTADGHFRIVYRFADEQLGEIINRTAHAGALGALVETRTSYRLYFAVYVRAVSRFTPLYMAVIDPFRKWIVYPALLRTISEQWQAAFGPADATRPAVVARPPRIRPTPRKLARQSRKSSR